MRFVLRLALLAATLTLAVAAPVSAQYMYLDSNGDGVHTAADRLNTNLTPTPVDVYLDLLHNRNGSDVACPVGGTVDMNSYVFWLQAVNGTVAYSGFTNQIASFTTAFAGPSDATYFQNGRGGSAYLAPAVYKLASLTINGQTGSPLINIIDQGTGSSEFTSFGTECDASGFGAGTMWLAGPNAPSGDWTDADGLAAAPGGGNVSPTLTVPANANGAENTLLTVSATATDPDAGNTLTISQTNSTPFLTFSHTPSVSPASASLSGTPNFDQAGNYSINWSVDDGAGGTDAKTTTIAIAQTNRAPVLATIGNRTANVGVALNFTATATDPDGNTLLFSLDAGSPAGAAINATSGVFSWTPASAGAFPITVRVTDTGQLEDFEAITVTVSAPANQAPVLGTIGNKTVTELTALTFTATATDPNSGDALTFSLDAGSPAGATIGAASGAFSWTPTEAQGPGVSPITVRVTDNGTPALNDFEAITVTVNEANLAPVVVNPGNRTIAELSALAFTATATDADLPANTLTWTLDAGAPAGATIAPGTGAFSWTPTEAQGPGTFPVTIRATDNGTPALAGTAPITITVTEVNVAPVLAPIGNKSAPVGIALTFTATATDADLPANTLAFSLDTGAPTGASINSGTGAFTWTPATGQVGGNSVTVRVTDNGTPPLSSSETITVTVVSAPNQAPVLAAIGNKTVNELASLTFTATATDPDASQILTFSLDAGAPAGATIGAANGAFAWTPTEGQGPGSFPVTVRVTDNGSPNLNDFEAITVTVNEVNVAPVVTSPGNQTVNELAALTFTATATDVDLPANTFTWSLDAGAPTGAAIAAGTGAFSWTPTEAQGPGTFPVTIRATDNGASPLSGTAAITITVNEVNVAPVLGAVGDKTVNELATLAFTATATDVDLPANTLAFSLGAGAPAGAAISATTGAFSWTPTEAQGPGSFPISVVVTDNGTPALSDNETITVTVNEVNVAPVLGAIGSKTVAELATLTFTATATDADLPANALAFSLGAGAPAGAAINASTGAFSWTPTEAQGPGSFPITVVVTDDGTPALSDNEAITVTVNEVNVAPVLAAIGGQAGSVGVPVTFTATATDADVPANTLAFSLDAGAPAGAAINATTGAFSWTPTSNGTFNANVRVTDNGTPALDDFEAVALVVSAAPNQAPVLGAIGNKTVNELATLTFTATATDPNSGDVLTFSLDAGAPAGATISGSTGAFSWTPTEAQGPGSFPITVRVTDDGTPQLSDNETITVTVNEVNVAPVLAPIGDKTVDELATLTFTATATDADVPANSLQWNLAFGAPSGAIIGLTTGVFSWTPTEAQGPGSYPVTIMVVDNAIGNLSDTETINITVDEVNSAPVLAAIGGQAGSVGVPVTFTATATDADVPANTLAFSLDAGAPAGATINATTGAFSWTPGSNGTFNVNVRVTDNGVPALNDFEAVALVVSAAPNQAPVLGAIGNKTLNEETNLAFTATATDPDAGQTLMFSLDAGSPAGAGIDGPSGAFSWTPTEPQGPGSYPITVRVTDDGTPNLNDSETITVTVDEVNAAPVLAAIGGKSGTTGVAITFTATATDADVPANTLTFSLDAGAPAGATINASTGAFSWTPSSAGTFNAVVRVTDNGVPALDDLENVAFTVSEQAVNHPPVLAAIGNKTVDELATLAFTATATDPDGADVLTFSLDAGAPAGAAITSGGAFSWTPTEVDGPDTFPVTVRVTDNGTPAMNDFEAITIAVDEVNLAPVLAAIGNKSGVVGSAITFTANATDSDIPSNTLAFSLDSGAPAGATIDPSSGAFSWTPAGAGSFQVRVRVTDNGTPVGEDFEELTITVEETQVNDPPVLAAIGNKTVNELAALTFTATATDPDAGDVLAFSLDAGAPAGAAIATGGAFSWTPTEAQGPGAYPVAVRVTDNGTPALDDFEAITITVNELNVAPVLTAIGNKSGTVGVAVTFVASATDADIPANTLSFSLDAGAPASAAINGSTGAFSWTPGAAGSFPVTVRVTDNGVPALDDFETITINVIEQSTNRPPVLRAIGDKTVNELNLLAFTATATDPDAGQTLAFSLDAGAPAGAAITTGGAFSWTPSEAQGPGEYSITARVTDNGVPPLSNAQTFKVKVREVNVAPVLAPIGNKTVKEGELLTFTATATDADLPANNLTFSLGSGAPSGASIGSSSGVFTWTPPLAGSYMVKVRVRDNGSSVMEDFEVITITVIGDFFPAHAFFYGINQITVLGIKLGTCVQIEPVRGSYANNDVDLTSIVMKYKDRQISAKCEADLDGDKNRNGVREIQACFSNKDLQYLFSDARRGISQVEVRIEGRLLSGGKFRDTVNHYVLLLANDCLALRATPNPLNPETVISFATAAAGPVTVEVFDVQGRLVKTLHKGTMEAGVNSVRWDGSTRTGNRAATGVYFVNVQSETGKETIRVTVLK